MLNQFATIGQSPTDSRDVKIQKAFLIYLAIFMSCGGIIWGTISLFYDLYFQSIFPYSYFIFTIINLTYFHFSKNFPVVRFIQTFISLALPFGFQWSLGGFDSSGVIMLWAILSLIASLSFQSITTSVNWLLFYIVLTIVSAILDDKIQAYKPEELPNHSVLFITINLILISSIVFGLVVFFVQQYKQAERQLEQERDVLKKTNNFLKTSHESLKRAFEIQRKNKIELEEQLVQEENKQLKAYEQILSEQSQILSKIEQEKPE